MTIIPATMALDAHHPRPGGLAPLAESRPSGIETPDRHGRTCLKLPFAQRKLSQPRRLPCAKAQSFGAPLRLSTGSDEVHRWRGGNQNCLRRPEPGCGGEAEGRRRPSGPVFGAAELAQLLAGAGFDIVATEDHATKGNEARPYIVALKR